MENEINRGERADDDPLSLYSGAFTDMERMFDRGAFAHEAGVAEHKVPLANLQAQENTYLIELAAPGMDKEDFSIDVAGDLLTISCRKEESLEEEKKNYSRREYNYSAFSRTFRLPEKINQDEVKARYENGVLQVSVPRTIQPLPGKRINIE